MAGAKLDVIACGDEEMLCRPCADCGRKTGRFCDWCHAKDRLPSEEWADNQMTPLCTDCDNKHGSCHYCRGLPWCTPPCINITVPPGQVKIVWPFGHDECLQRYPKPSHESGAADGTASEDTEHEVKQYKTTPLPPLTDQEVPPCRILR